MSDPVARLLSAVRRRLALAAWGRSFILWLAVCAGVAVLAAPLVWLSEEVKWHFVRWAVPAAVLLAAGLTTAFARRVTTADAALRADRSLGTKDLFLTSAELRDASFDYAPVVKTDAAKAAAGVDPARVVPFEFPGKRLVPAGVCLAVLAGALFLFPRLDPFGTAAEAEEIRTAAVESAATTKAAEERAAELKRRRPDADLSPEVQAAVDDLKNTFKRAEKTKVPKNRRTLADRRKGLGEKWRQLSAKQLRDLFSGKDLQRSLGGRADEKTKEWLKDLRKGSGEALERELDELLAEAAAAAEETDPDKRAEKLAKLAEKIRRVEKFAQEKAGSPELSAALKQAAAQVAKAAERAAKGEPMTEADKQAMQAAAKSLELSKLETEQLAQAARDLERLEKALKAIQEAKKLNELGELDGEACEQCQSMDEFLAAYEKMLEQQGLTPGGMDRGEREELAGDVAPEDDTVDTDFKSEQSKSAVTAGKMLMSMTSKGLSEAGEDTQEYRAQVDRVASGVDEAILSEQVPPGYTEGIKGYFDSLRADADGTDAGE